MTDKIENKEVAEIFEKYTSFLRENNLFDLDDLIYETVKMFIAFP